jgi:hypothetical protein
VNVYKRKADVLYFEGPLVYFLSRMEDVPRVAKPKVGGHNPVGAE